MNWEVEYTDEFDDWFQELDADTQRGIDAAVALLRERGPALGRPAVDTIKGSRYPNMKELRPFAGSVRILFAFDPRRTAILLLGGDKRDRWDEWYETMVPLADRLYEDYLLTLHREGLLP
jgi:hypothetical protein